MDGTLTVRTSHHGRIPIVHLIGEVDMETAEPMSEALLREVDRRPSAVVVDLTTVDFFGSTGIRILVSASRHAEDHGVDLVLAANKPIVVRALHVTEVDKLIAVHPTVDEAVLTFTS
jgi:anti-sigma B factor antagonist